MTAHASPLCRATFGNVRVTFLPDGEIRQPVEAMYGDRAAVLAGRPELVDEHGLLVLSLGSILIETGSRHILVDLAWGPSRLDLARVGDGSRRGTLVGGDLLASLHRAGVHEDDVDLVVFTHLHADHVGWLLNADGAVTFPRARYGLSGPEWQHWLSRVGDGSWGGPTGEQMSVLSGIVAMLDDGAPLAPGVTFMWTVGHTPGHGAVVIDAGARRGIVVGDAMHCPLELADDRLALRGDADPVAAARARAWIRDELAAGTVVIGPHFAPDVFVDNGRFLDMGAAIGLR
jgi:glyoxylase-like metal-dependent hydrolase (beta-lactamase superfamily II)